MTAAAGSREGFRLSPHQLRQVAAAGHSSSSSVTARIAIEGSLDVAALERSLFRLIERHESLRTRFVRVAAAGEVLQVVQPASHASLSAVPVGLDPWEGRVLDARLVTTAPERHELTLAVSAWCADRAALRVALGDLAAFYAVEIGTASPYLTDAMQLADVAEWERSVLEAPAESATIDAVRARWRELDLKQFGAAALPCERRRTGTSDAGTLGVVSPPGGGLSAATVATVAAAHDAEAGSVVLALWLAFLARIMDRAQIAAGIACDGRPYDDLRDAVAPLARWVPLEVRIDPEASLDDVLLLVDPLRRTAVGAQHQFDAAWLGPTTDAVAPVLFAWETAVPSLACSGVSFAFTAEEQQPVAHRLALEARTTADAVAWRLTFDPSVIDRAIVERLASRFAVLAAAALAAPAAPLCTIPWLDDESRIRLRQLGAGAPLPVGERPVQRWFTDQAGRFPDANAIVGGDEVMSYGELAAAAHRLTNRLRRLGIDGGCVGVYTGPTASFVTAMLGVLGAGAAYVPLDPEHPPARSRSQLAAAGARMLVTTTALRARIGDPACPLLCVDAPDLADESATDPEIRVAGDAPAYVIFTSGSTAQPKAVVVSHSALANYTGAIAARLGLAAPGSAAGMRFGFVSTVAADLGHTVLFLSLTRGGELHAIAPDTARDGGLFRTYVQKWPLDVLKIVPSHFAALAAGGEDGDVLPRRWLVLGGEALPLQLATRLAAAGGGCRILNHYGPTETTVGSLTCEVVPDAVPAGCLTVPIGRPLANVDVVVVDARGEFAEIGVPGELHIGGAGLADGYLGQPEETARRFLPHVGGRAGARTYRTGDRVRWLADGSLEFLGRVDDEVKVRGFRVSPGELEASVRAHAAVAQAVVAAIERPTGDQELIACVVPVAAARDGFCRLPNGMLVAQQNAHETAFFYRQVFVDRTAAAYGVELPADACVFDVGANIGLFALEIASRRPAARLYCFEPIPATCERLRLNLALHELQPHVFECGLSDRDARVDFTYYPNSSCQSGYRADADGDRRVLERVIGHEGARRARGVDRDEVGLLVADRLVAQSVPARVRRLSDVLRETGVERIDLLKIDVERAELDVLCGIDDADWARIDQVVVEVHDEAGRLAALTALLDRHGYRVAVAQDPALANTGIYEVIARRAADVAPAPTAAAPDGEFLSVPLAEALQHALARVLPSHLMPSRIVVCDRLPLTGNGKPDRDAIAVLAQSTAVATTRPFRTPIEAVIATVWEEVLDVPVVGADDDFFALGGHSLLATRAIARLRRSLGVEVSLRALFEAPTVASLAARVEALQATPGAPPVPPLVCVERPEPLPLSFGQQRLWMLHQLHPESAAYNVPLAWRLRGPLDAGALAAGLADVVQRHEVLRTRFMTRDGVPSQAIDDAAAIRLDRVVADDATGFALLRAAAGRPFDLGRGPVLRALLVHVGDDDHLLGITVHHIAADGWSTALLVQELAAGYAAYAAGRAPELPPLPIQYADVALWQQRRLLDEDLMARELTHWRTALAGAPDTLALPTDHPRPPVQRGRGGRTAMTLPRPLTDAVVRLGRADGCSLFMTLLAAFQALLHRWAQQDDLCIGSVIANRQHVETESLIGFLFDTVVLRARFDDDPTFRTHLARARDMVLAAHAHRELPFERLVEALQPARDLSRNPLVQAMLILQNLPDESLVLTGIAVEAIALPRATAQMDLIVSCWDGPDGLVVWADYDSDLFTSPTIERLLGGFAVLLQGAVTDPTQPVSVLPVMTAAERDHVLTAWNPPASPPAAVDDVPSQIAAQAARTPLAPAVVASDAALSYCDLVERAGALARRLRALGVERGTRVGLCVERSANMVVGLLGILDAGAVYLPLDPGLPRERLRFMLDDAAVTVVVTDARVRDVLTDTPATLVEIDGEHATTGLLRTPVGPQDEAYVIYTSGSTGVPKGVAVPHGALANFVAAMRDEPGIAAADRVAAVTTLSFDIAALEILVPLATGATIVVCDRDTARDPLALARWLDEHDITVLQATPSTWRMLVDAGWPGRPPLRALCGGEALSRPLAERLLPRVAALWNMYGPTETTIWSSVERVIPGAAPVGLGHPIRGTRLYVLDRHRQPVPPGVVGELWIAGEGVALGYVGRPELTAERFIDDPFAAVSGDRMYRTGDLVVRRTDGRLEFIGRADQQVKLRGHRVELGEVEAALRQHPAVRDAVVVLRHDGDEPRLVGYVVGGDHEELRQFLGTRLPAVMVPSAIVRLAAMPLTPSGKIDRQALPAPMGDRPEGGAAFVPPVAPIERDVARLCGRIFEVSRVGLDDNFFDLGGTSLSLIRLATAMREELRADVPVLELFQHPTVRSLAGFLGGATVPDGFEAARRAAVERRERLAARRTAAAIAGAPR